MRTFPENKYEGDVQGSGTSVELIADMVKTRSKYVEIRMLRDEKYGFGAGTFGQFQSVSNGEVTMSVRFMGNGEGGIDVKGVSTNQLDPDTPIEWVIHREEI